MGTSCIVRIGTHAHVHTLVENYFTVQLVVPVDGVADLGLVYTVALDP